MSSKNLFIIIIVMPLLSCGLIDFSSLEILTSPASADEVASKDTELSLLFSVPMDKIRTEDLFSLNGPSGIEDGDFDWAGEKLIFTPAEELRPGFRYKLKFEGDAAAVDGRIFSKSIILPFYYLTDETPPLLASFSPPDAETVGVKQMVKLSFTKTIDIDIFEKEFSLSPSSEVIFIWNDEKTELEIKPKKKWSSMQFYNWKLPVSITDTDGIPFPSEYDGSFLVQADSTAPALLSCHPASDNGDGSFTVQTNLNLGELECDEHIAVLFSEDIDFNSLEKTFSIHPDIDGCLVALRPSAALFRLEEKPLPEENYELTIGEGLADLSGNETAEDIIIDFTPDIRFQKITGIGIEDENGLFKTVAPSDFNDSGFIAAEGLNYYGTDSLHFIIDLSEPYPDSAEAERSAFVSEVSLAAVFPPGTAAPERWLSLWENETRLRIIYKSLISCSEDEPVYYRFNIDSGNTETATPSGSYLEQDVFFSFIAEDSL